MPKVEPKKSFFTKSLESGKLLASTIMVFSALLVGTWGIVSSVFITRAQAYEKIEKLDVESSYNKAFRIDSMITRYEQIQKRRELTQEEKRALARLKRDLKRTDLHIDFLEKRVYGQDTVK